jgi:4-hydroxy-3-methylbut-2-enyl diphosphate reductase
LNYPEGTKLAYLTQTTLSVSETQKMTYLLHRRFPQIAGPPKANICYATQNRQDAVGKFCADRESGVDVVLIVGSRTSSNSCRLAEKAETLGICAYLIDGHHDISSGLFRGDETVLISAGASAPEYVVQECVNVLQNRFAATVEEKTVCEENVHFRLPKELQS